MAKVSFFRESMPASTAFADALRDAGLAGRERAARRKARRVRPAGRVVRRETTDGHGSVVCVRESWEALPTNG